MTVENINVEAAIKRVNDLIVQERDLSPALKASLEVLLLLVTILANRLGLNSKNSSKSPSSDPNRKKKSKEQATRQPGGQQGHKGTTLKPFPDPDLVKVIPVDRSALPQGTTGRLDSRPARLSTWISASLLPSGVPRFWKIKRASAMLLRSQRRHKTGTIRYRCQDQRCLYVSVSVDPVQPYRRSLSGSNGHSDQCRNNPQFQQGSPLNALRPLSHGSRSSSRYQR